MLNAQVYPAERRGSRRIVLVHGFTQASGVWAGLAGLLSGEFEVICVDLPGHGSTDPSHDATDLEGAARLVGEIGSEAVYVGYSLGARVLLHLAVQSPDLVEGMMLFGAKVAMTDESERQQRLDRDEAMATALDNATSSEFATFIDDWLNLPFNVRVAPERSFRALRLENRPAGLAASLRNCGSGKQDLGLDDLSQLTMPVMFVAGEDDIDQVAVDTRAMFETVGVNAMLLTARGCGHSVPFELSDEVMAQIVADFLGETSG